MHSSTLITFALLLSSTFAIAKDVRVLNARNFKRLVTGSDKLTIASFTAPWCGHCKSAKPELEKAAGSLKGLVNFGNKAFCGEMGIKGFPTIKVYPGGSAPSTSYDGERKAKAFVDFALSRMPSFVKKIATADALEKLRDQSAKKTVALLFTSAKTVTPMYKSLSSSFHKKIDFYAAKESTIGEAAMAEFGVKKVPSLVVIKAGVVALYDGPLKIDDLKAFLSPFAEKETVAKPAKASPKVEL